MITLVYVKLGTIPFGPARVKSKRKLPVVDDVIFIREDREDKTKHTNPWIKVKVDKISEDVCYFVSKTY